ncbi:MAG: NAD-dependent epimerase/dehydratase family protein, partial [Proteiniphilum sp.]
MNILITGAKGFIGKNLIAELNNIKEGKAKGYNLTSDLNLFAYDIDTDPALLDGYCKEADFVFHLAGVNRPKEQSEFMEGNFGFTSLLLDTLKKQGNYCPVMLASSIQAELVNPYGISKKAGEDLLFDYGRETGAEVLIYRFPNVFGKWCRPNYNSAVATFCHNIAHNLPIQVNDRNVPMTLVYIYDVVKELISALESHPNKEGDFCKVPVEYRITLGEIVDLIYSFKESRKDLQVPDLSDAFTKKLYSTYLSD